MILASFFKHLIHKYPSPEVKELRSRLKAIFGFKPAKFELYQEALRHRSLNIQNEELPSNERLEFLGDAILDAVVSEHLFSHYPNSNEGFLTQMRSKIVSRERLNRIASNLGIQDLIEHELGSTDLSHSIGGNALEALIGAVYLDKGYDRTREYIIKTILGTLDLHKLEKMETDHKSRALEWSQKNRYEMDFLVISSPESSDGGSNYKVALTLDGEQRTTGEGNTKKKAEQEAARKFLE